MPAKGKPDLTSIDPCQDENQDSEHKQRLENCADIVIIAEDEDEDYEEEEGDDDEDDEDEDGDYENSKGQEVVDRKGKGILKDDKGKGKWIEESLSDDSSKAGSGSDGDGRDLSEDTLAELDLDNILPSRTRRPHLSQPGVYISKDPHTNHGCLIEADMGTN